MAGGGFRRSLRQFTVGKGKTGGRNNTGSITSWHRGGGHKRKQRIIDTKRNTPSIGVVERIEYDPNRSTRIALVRWTDVDYSKFNAVEEKFDQPEMNPEPVTRAVKGAFAFATLPGRGGPRVLDGVSSGLKSLAGVVRIPAEKPLSKSHFVTKRSKLTSARDVLVSAYFPESQGESSPLSSDTSLGPRIAVAGARAPFFAFRRKEEVGGGKDTFSLSEIQRWSTDSNLWKQRLRREAAVKWTGINVKPKMDKGLYAKPKNGMPGPDRVAVSYIIATHQMKVGSMVMNVESPKPLTN